jgi:trimeric autotransporter adhesin
MADRYWVGGTATWDATAGSKWALTSGGAGGEAVPTANDDVYFDSASGAVTVSVATGALCRNLSFTSGAGDFAGTFAGGGSMSVSGSLALVAAMTRTYTGTITFNSTTNQTITTAGQQLDSALVFDGVNGEWQLQDALTTGATRQVSLNNGTIDLNSKNLTCRSFASNNSNTRAIKFGTAEIFLTGNALTAIGMNTATGFTFTGSGVFNLTYSGSTGTRTCRFGNVAGGSISNAPNIKISAGTDALNLSPSFWRDVDHTGFGGTVSAYSYACYGDWTCPSGVTFTGSSSPLVFGATTSKTITTGGSIIDSPITFDGVGGVWAFQDALTTGAGRIVTLTNGTVQLRSGVTSTVGGMNTSGTNQKFLQSTTPGVRATLSDDAGTNTMTFTTIRDINATGGATWDAFTTSGNVDAGNNLGWDFSTQVGRYIYTRRKNKRILP